MARIYKPTYTLKGPDGERITRKSQRWYIDYRDSDKRRRRVPGLKDKRATEQRAAELERASERGETGLGRFEEHRKRPLAEHAQEWYQLLLNGGATKAYADLSKKRVETVLKETTAITWPEVSANRVSAYLAVRRAKDLSAESSNHYLR